jgi:hypothetical protein
VRLVPLGKPTFPDQRGLAERSGAARKSWGRPSCAAFIFPWAGLALLARKPILRRLGCPEGVGGGWGVSKALVAFVTRLAMLKSSGLRTNQIRSQVDKTLQELLLRLTSWLESRLSMSLGKRHRGVGFDSHRPLQSSCFLTNNLAIGRGGKRRQ